MVIRRIGDYAADYVLTPLSTVARNSKSMPDEFIDADASTVTDAFKKYARPLIGEMAEYGLISAPSVKKILNL